MNRQNFLILLLFLSSLLSARAWSTTGRVEKVQGNRAIVDFDQKVNPGDLVQTSDEITSKSQANNSAIIASSRRYAFEYSWQSDFETVSGGSLTMHNGNGTFWFNYQQYEFGPIVSFFNAGGSTAIGAGGIAQWDFFKNVVGAKYVPAVYGKLLLTSTSGGNSSTATTMGVGGSFDWFPFAEHVALNASIEYDTLSNAVGAQPSSQIAIISGAKVYF